MDEAFLDSTSTHSGVLEAAEPTEEWLSTGSDLLTTTTDGDLPLSSAILEQAESSAASELDASDGSLLHEEQAIGSMEELGFLEANAPLQSLPELPLEEDAAVCSEVMSADLASEQQRLWPCSTPVQNRLSLDLDAGEEQLRSSAQPESSGPAQLPSFAPRRPGRALETPFAESCAESPFEAPSPRDMQLSPAEEQLIPASGLTSPKELNVEQALVHPRSPVLPDRSKTEQILWKPVRHSSKLLLLLLSSPCVVWPALAAPLTVTKRPKAWRCLADAQLVGKAMICAPVSMCRGLQNILSGKLRAKASRVTCSWVDAGRPAGQARAAALALCRVVRG